MGDRKTKTTKGIPKNPKPTNGPGEARTVTITRPCRNQNEVLETRVSEPRLSYHKGCRTPVPGQSKSATLIRQSATPPASAPSTNGLEKEEIETPESMIEPVAEPSPVESPKTTPPDQQKPLSMKEIRELRAEVIRQRRLAKGDFPDNDGIRTRKPGQLPWRVKTLEVPVVDVNEEEFDSELEEELELAKLAGSIQKEDEYDQTGRAKYLEACAKHQTTPISIFIRNMENKKFILKYRGIGTRGARALASALEVNPNFEHLILAGNHIESRGGFYISEAIRDNTSIIQLDLSENCLGGVGACAICDMLCDNKTLVELDLSGNSLEDSDASVFQHMLMENGTLKKLLLSYNHFEDQATKCFGDALADNCTLEHLDLSWNHIRMNGAKRLFQGIRGNIGLTHLDVSMNGFDLDGARAVAEALKVNRTLLELDVSRNRIPEAGGKVLGEALKVNDTLKVFRCARNPILPDGAMAIIRGIDKHVNSGMEFLDLSDDFVRKDFVELKDKLEKERIMRIIHGNVIRDEHFEPEQQLVMTVESGIMDDPMTKVRNYCDKAGLRLIDLFKQFDKDQSMTLTRDEIRKGIKVKKIKMSENEIDRLLDQLDTDGDGEVDYGELVYGDRMHRGVKRRVKAKDIERTRRLSLIADDPTIKVVEKQVSMLELVEEVMWIEDNRSEWHKKIVKMREENEESSSESESDEDNGRRKGILSGTA